MTETPESEPPKKRERKSSSKKGAKEKGSGDGEGEAPEEEDVASAAAEETKTSVDVEMKDAEDGGDMNKEEVATGEAVVVENTLKQDSQQNNEEETSLGKPENPGLVENKENMEEEQPAEDKAPPPPSVPNDNASSYEEVKEAISGKETKMDVEASQKDAKEGEDRAGECLPDNGSLKEIQNESKLMEMHSMNCEDAQHQPKASSVSC